MSESVLWNPASPPGWIDRIEETFTYVEDVYLGRCPTCGHDMSKDLRTVRIPVNLLPEETTVPVYVSCNCGHPHAGRPEHIAAGCGSDGYLRVRM